MHRRDRDNRRCLSEVMVKFLDDRLIYVEFQRINNDQAQAAAAALTAKFGPPTKALQDRGRFTYTRDTVQATRHLWKDGDIVLVASPFELYDKKVGKTFSSVLFYNVPKHADQWIPRHNNRSVKPSDDI